MAAKSKELRVELTAGVKGFQKGFKEAEDIAQGWGKKLGASFGMIATPAGLASLGIGAVTAGIAAVGAVAAAAGAGLALATKGMLDYGGAIAEASDRSGHTITWLQEMKYAAGQAGMELAEVVAASTKLRQSIGEGAETTSRYLSMLGLSLEELRNSSPDEQMDRVLKAIEGIEDPTARTTIALGLMGKSASGMTDLANGLEGARAKAHDLGQVMDEDAVRAADALGDRIKDLTDSFGGMTREIGSVITSNESLHQLVDGLAEVFATLTGSVRENSDGFQSLVSHGVLLLVKGFQVLAEVIGSGMDVYSGLSIAWNRLDVAATSLAIGFSRLAMAKAVLSGDDEMAKVTHASIAALEAEKVALEKHESDLVVAGWNRADAIEKTKRQLADLEKAIKNSVGKKIVPEAGKPGGGDVDLTGSAERSAMERAAREAARLADQVRAFSSDLEIAMAQAGARGFTGIEGAFAKVEADSLRMTAKLRELIRDGLDPRAAALFAERIDEVSAALKDAAFEAERMAVLGATFKDLEQEGANLRDVLLHTDIATLTADALLGTEQQLKALRDAGVEVADSEKAVRDEIQRRKLLGLEVEKQSDRQHYKLEAMLESERARAEAAAEEWTRMIGVFDAVADAIGGVGAMAGALGFGDFGEKVKNVAGFADDLGSAIEDGVLSWGEMLALGGQVIEGIKSVFSTPKWEKLAAGVGRKWGVTISDELAKQIEEDSDRLGDNAAAMLSNLPSIIEEAGGIGSFGFDKAAAGAHDLFSMIETGKMTVAEAGETFDEVFGQMLPEALDSVTGLAKDSFLELVELDKRFGTNSKNVQAFMASQNTALMKGLEAVAKGAKLTEKSAAGVAASVVVAYKQLREQGVSARDALQQMAPSIESLREKLEELGVGGGAAFDVLAEQTALYADETAGPLLEAINGAGDSLVALHNLGALTQESFSGLTAAIGDTYNELIATGKAGPAAMQAIAPDLQRVWELQKNHGYAVDETTQALLNEAVAAGIVGESHVSAQDKMAASAERLNVILEAIAKSMGIDIPAAAQSAAEGVQKAFDGITPPDLNGSYSYSGSGVPTEPLPAFSRGGIGDFGSGTMAMLHGREWIVPADRMEGLLSRGGGPSITIDARSMLDPRQNYESERRQNEHVASVTTARMVRKLSTAIELGSA